MFRLPTPGYTELCDICKQELQSKYGLSAFSPEAERKLLRFFQYQVKIKDDTFGYAHLAVKTAEDIFTSFISRGSQATMIEETDIRGYVPVERTLEDILSDLDHYIGMDEVKKAVREIAFTVHNNVQRAQRGLGEQEKAGIHIVLTGNPGTGKTTIARKLGEIMEAIGYLDSGHVVEVDRSKMIDEAHGGRPRQVYCHCSRLSHRDGKPVQNQSRCTQPFQLFPEYRGLQSRSAVPDYGSVCQRQEISVYT